MSIVRLPQFGVEARNLLVGQLTADQASYTLPSVDVRKGDLLVLTVTGHALDLGAVGLLQAFSFIGGIPGAVDDSTVGNFETANPTLRKWHCPDVGVSMCRTWGPTTAPEWNGTLFLARADADGTGQIVVTYGETASVLFYCLDAISGLELGNNLFGHRGDFTIDPNGFDGFGLIVSTLRQAVNANTANAGPGMGSRGGMDMGSSGGGGGTPAILYASMTGNVAQTIDDANGKYTKLGEFFGGTGVEAGVIASHIGPATDAWGAGPGIIQDSWSWASAMDGLNYAFLLRHSPNASRRRAI